LTSRRPASIAWKKNGLVELIDRIRQMGITVILVEHDMEW
jgi:ABC-type branched-subunit amino acid transport system ATPase component